MSKIVFAAVVDAVKVRQSDGAGIPIPQRVAFVPKRHAVSKSASREIIEVQIPFRPRRPLFALQKLIKIPTGKNLRSENAVVPKLQMFKIERAVLNIHCHPRPIEDGQVADRHEIVFRDNKLFVERRLFACRRIDNRRAAHLIVERLTASKRRQRIRLEPVLGPPHHTRRNPGVRRVKSVRVALNNLRGAKSEESAVHIGNFRDNFRVLDNTDLIFEVVIHLFSVNDAVSLPENDVSVEIDFKVRVSRLGNGRRRQLLEIKTGRPHNRRISGKFERFVYRDVFVVDSLRNEREPVGNAPRPFAVRLVRRRLNLRRRLVAVKQTNTLRRKIALYERFCSLYGTFRRLRDDGRRRFPFSKLGPSERRFAVGKRNLRARRRGVLRLDRIERRDRRGRFD